MYIRTTAAHSTPWPGSGAHRSGALPSQQAPRCVGIAEGHLGGAAPRLAGRGGESQSAGSAAAGAPKSAIRDIRETK
jgi:hypothetical protein|eukprot:SAG25_NODE_242_length_11160_cov_254.065546_12_plen_77_part_00